MSVMGVGATVMVVEDEPNIGSLVRTYLAREGYTVIWVRSGEDALTELGRHPVRLVVLEHRPARDRRLRGLPADRRRGTGDHADRAR